MIIYVVNLIFIQRVRIMGGDVFLYINKKYCLFLFLRRSWRGKQFFLVFLICGYIILRWGENWFLILVFICIKVSSYKFFKGFVLFKFNYIFEEFYFRYLSLSFYFRFYFNLINFLLFFFYRVFFIFGYYYCRGFGKTS